jgi:hypothetical protein
MSPLSRSAIRELVFLGPLRLEPVDLLLHPGFHRLRVLGGLTLNEATFDDRGLDDSPQNEGRKYRKCGHAFESQIGGSSSLPRSEMYALRRVRGNPSYGGRGGDFMGIAECVELMGTPGRRRPRIAGIRDAALAADVAGEDRQADFGARHGAHGEHVVDAVADAGEVSRRTSPARKRPAMMPRVSVPPPGEPRFALRPRRAGRRSTRSPPWGAPLARLPARGTAPVPIPPRRG